MVEEHSALLTSRHSNGAGGFDISEFSSTINPNPLSLVTSSMTPAATDTSNTSNSTSATGNNVAPITIPSGGGTNRPLPPPPIGATPINPVAISMNNTNISSNSSNTNSSGADRELTSNSRETSSNLTSNEPLTTPEKIDSSTRDSKDLSGSDADQVHGGGSGEHDRTSKQSSPEANSPSGRSNLGESPKPGTSSGGGRADSTSPRSPDETRTSSGHAGKDTTQQPSSSSGGFVVNPTSAARRLKQENERLQAELTRLRRLVITNAAAASNAHNKGEDGSPLGSQTLDLELQVAREAIVALRADRKRLKAEKFELLNQMKQLYATLEDKEKELRDFIRNYEQRVRESDASLQQLSTEREERERERWSLLRHARDEAERSLSLAAQLNAKELQLRQAHEQLRDARRQLHGCLSDGEESRGRGGLVTTPGSLAPGDRGSCSADSGVVRDRAETASSIGGNLSDSTTDGAPTITVEGSNMDMDNISVVSSVAPPHLYQLSTPKDCSPTLSPLNANAFSRSIDAGILSRSVEQLSSPLGDGEPMPSAIGRRKPSSTRPGGRGGTWGSISRVFARSRHRNKAASAAIAAVAADGGEDAAYRSWSPLTEEGYAEKLRLLREAASVPMERWRAPTVLAWLEIALGMPQYGPRCAENVKSGKLRALNGQVLLELSDLELECGLGITHPMHRKKLRLAIEEHRHPSLVRYPCIAQLGHTWVSSEWLPDLGLAQYSDSFAANMVDARMLEHLSKKELEKYLGVTRKFHQASVVHGIHLLRIMRYDRQALAVRRHQCETVDADPLVWSNQRFIRWARSIDLAEYADNLRDSGVHGGLVVLEPSFNGDTMATALGIPPGKNIVRRHLAAELEALILPARSTMGHVVRGKTRALSGGSLGRPPAPHMNSTASIVSSTSSTGHQEYSRTTGLRGSLSRALGLARSRSDKHSPTSSSESSSVVSASRVSVSPLQQSGGESPVYATPYNFRYSYSGSGRDRISDRDSCECRSTTAKDYLDNFVMDGSGSSLRRHRRVRSIGDIDVIPIAPV